MASPWIQDDEDDAWDEMAAGTDRPTDGQGTPLPFVDPSVAAELSQDGPPAWMGTRWREIEAEHQWDAWNTLRRWVDWFVGEYRLGTSVVPACWFRHPDVTAELYAAMCMEYKVWEEQAPGLGPMMMWHPHVEMLQMRLRRMGDEAGCTKTGAHKEPEAYGARGAYEIDYDEADWLRWSSTEREHETVERPEKGVRYFRARIVDSDGAAVGTSNMVALGAAAKVEDIAAKLIVASSTPSAPRLAVAVASGRDDLGVEWETSPDGEVWDAQDEGAKDDDGVRGRAARVVVNE